MSRSRIIAVLAGLGIAGLVAAAAAQLDVNADDLGAGVTLVASCDDEVDVSFTALAFDSSIGDDGGAKVTQVTISDVAERCADQNLTLVLTETNLTLQEPLVTVTDTAASPTTVIAIPGVVDAAAVTGVAISITGADGS